MSQSIHRTLVEFSLMVF